MSPTHSSFSRQVRKGFLKHPVTASQTSVQSLSAVSHPFLLPAMEPRQAHLSSPAPCPVKCHHHSCTVCLLTYCDLSEAAKHHHLRYFHPPPKNQFSLPCGRNSRRTQVLTCRKKLGKGHRIGLFWKEVKRGEKQQRGTGPSCVLHVTHCELLTHYSYKSQRPSAGAQVSGSPHHRHRATQRNKLCVHAATCTGLKCTALRERSRPRKLRTVLLENTATAGAWAGGRTARRGSARKPG